MRRIEPTIGDTELTADPAATHARALAKARRTRAAIKDWIVIALLSIVLVVGCALLVSRAGYVPQQFQLDAPQLLQRSLIVGGLLVVFAAQLVGTLLLFRCSFVQGGLALFVPGYIFFALKRNALYVPVIGTLCAGLLAVTVGTILLS